MAIYSMTGYATAASTAASQTDALVQPPSINIEIRTVNSRFLDIHFRMPDELRAIEAALRTLISSKLKRGKVELRLNLNNASDQTIPQVSDGALQGLRQLSEHIRSYLPDVSPLSITDVLRLSQSAVTLEDIQTTILTVAEVALKDLLQARQQEGERLAASMLERTAKLRILAQSAAPLIPEAVELQRQRFLERWEQSLSSLQASHATPESIQERALAEATSFAMRIDIAEEVTRLASHLDEIDRLLNKGGEAGKRLDFLIQELHREANTLGSKSINIELAQIAMEMKVLIEQMREQVQNIE